MDSLRLQGWGHQGPPLMEDAPQQMPATLLELFQPWGGKWMWSGLTLPEDPSWVAQLLAAGTLICVTDGSYDRKKVRDLSGAGYVIYCTATKHRRSQDPSRNDRWGLAATAGSSWACSQSTSSCTQSSPLTIQQAQAPMYTATIRGLTTPSQRSTSGSLLEPRIMIFIVSYVESSHA